MNFNGIVIAVLTFLIIGLYHPLVINAEYYFSKKIWPLFGIAGVIFIFFSVHTESTLAGTVLAVFGARAFWSIKELYEQEKRVEKGWFPKNPHRNENESEEIYSFYEVAKQNHEK